MIVKQIYTNCLAQASYYIESEGEAAIVDPIRDVDSYLEMAAERKADIRYVLITHFHADFVSGHLELARKTNAIIVFGPQAKPAYPALVASDHQFLSLGNCRIEILHTPGHTIESSCFLLYNEDNKPYAVFSGDTLFVGDTGRPDLMSGNLDAKELASKLHDSLRTKLRSLPDDVIVYPGHGAGSACGKNLGKETSSTIGQQKKMNYALNLNKDEFITAITTDQPFAPNYFFKDAQINVKGYESLDTVLQKGLKALSADEFKNEMNRGAIVMDTRSSLAFGRKFIKGSINIGLGGQFAIWAGTLLDFNHPLLLLTDPGDEKQAVTRLARIGYENLKGYLNNGMDAWMKANGESDTIRTVSIKELRAEMPGHTYILIDVRKAPEAANERLPGAVLIPLEELNKQMKQLDKEQTYAIYCVSGYRSMIAASMLKRNGFRSVLNINGGIAEIKKESPELMEFL